MVGFGAGRCLTDGSTSLTCASSGVYIGSLVRGCANGEVNAIAIGYNTYSCGSNTVNIGNSDTTCTYVNGCVSTSGLTVTGNVSASGNGYFACVIAGGYFEEKVASPKLAEYPTGSLVVIGNDGELELSTRENDTKVFGITQNGARQPIVLGAEPVLVTGDIKIGDFITTSDQPGHGKVSMNTIHGTIIAQSMGSGTGKSHLVKAMIRKM